jgi:hypothetical protein
MLKKLAGFFLMAALFFQAPACLYAAERVESMDKNKDGKADTWYHYRNGAVYKKEYDRNFDGKADFGIIIEGQKLIEKKYDDNFDGRFETSVKSPEKGTSGKIQTSAPTTKI